MTTEPTYLAQNGEKLPLPEQQAWFRERGADAVKRGATHARTSVHPELGLLLFEGWVERPDDEGEPRWQLVAGQNGV